jgi:hypothetical protein
MTIIELGPDVRLVKVGDWARARKDPELQPPRDITGRFPPKSENFKCGPEGTWYATVEELVLVKEGNKKVKRPRHRIHWLSASGELRVAQALPLVHHVAFETEIALLTCDRGQLEQLRLSDGAVTPLPLAGHTFRDEARLWEIYLLEGERVVIRESLDNALVIAKRTADGLVFLARHTFQGAFTVVGKRFLVGGGKSVHVLDLAGDTPREVASTGEVGVGMIWGYGPKVRIYSREAGTWEIRPGAGQAE